MISEIVRAVLDNFGIDPGTPTQFARFSEHSWIISDFIQPH
jgi:hypothetical protein